MTEQSVNDNNEINDQRSIPESASTNVESVSTTSESKSSAPSTATETDEFISKRAANDLIHKRTKEASDKAYERGKQEALAGSKADTVKVGLGGMPSIDEDRIRQMMREELKSVTEQERQTQETRAYQKQVNDLAHNFMSKIAAAKDTHPDLIKRQQEIADLALLVPYINETSEVAGITQHLLDNEGAYANLLVLSQQSPDRVRRALKKIESSVRQNEDARTREYPNEPFSDPTPSINAMDSDSGSVEARKKLPWLRG